MDAAIRSEKKQQKPKKQTHSILCETVKSHYYSLSDLVTAPLSFCSIYSLKRLYMPIKNRIMFFSGISELSRVSFFLTL